MVVMTVATMYALFADDIRLAATDKSADIYFYWLTFIVLMLFSLEFICFCIAKKNFLWGFFFWLDLVACLSLLPDIEFLWSPILEAFGGSIYGQADQDLSVARAGRASRAGTKAGRMFRVIRIIRLVRIAKLYKYCGSKSSKLKEEDEEEEEGFSGDISGSRIGNDLSEFIMRRVIIGVLLMLLVFPILTPLVDDGAPDISIYLLESYTTSNSFTSTAARNSFVSSSISNFLLYYGDNLMYFVFNGNTYKAKDPSVDNRRMVEITNLTFSDINGALNYTMYIDNKSASQLDAVLNLCMTVFILILLGLGAWTFSKDAHESVINPLERMVKFVRALAANPLGKITMKQDPKGSQLETALLEKTLMKLAGLLQVGFGDAGAEVIAANLGKNGLNPTIPGQKIFAIYGFCDIRKFGDCTVCLQEQTMVFVNQIADIVHERCSRFSGQANKNIGNAFLMIWKFPTPDLGKAVAATKPRGSGMVIAADGSVPLLDDMVNSTGGDTLETPKNGNVPGTPSHVKAGNMLSIPDESQTTTEQIFQRMIEHPLWREVMTKMADQALLGFAHTVIEIATSPLVNAWRKDPRLVEVGYDVNMGFGLHTGWAIEGAIGSQHKIDASYLSPNVNMSARLETASKQYGVPFLFSGDIWQLLQPEIQDCCRHLDCVTVKGSLLPIDIYTLDMKPELVDKSAPGYVMFAPKYASNFNLMSAAANESAEQEMEETKKSRLQQAKEKAREKIKDMKPKFGSSKYVALPCSTDFL